MIPEPYNNYASSN